MGIKGLTTILESKRIAQENEGVEEESRIAKEELIPAGSTLVIDGDSFVYEVLNSVASDNLNLLRECGGVYTALHDKVCTYIEKFRSAGLKLVIYFDGYNYENKFKQETWDRRGAKDDNDWSKICYRIMIGDECPRLPNVGPELTYSQVRASIIGLIPDCTFCDGEAGKKKWLHE